MNNKENKNKAPTLDQLWYEALSMWFKERYSKPEEDREDINEVCRKMIED